MSLIKCPECGKEISDKSEKCIHCGYPIRAIPNICEMINGKEYELDFLIDNSISKIDKIKMIKETTSCDLKTAKSIADKYCPTPRDDSFNNIPCCPTCQSTNIKQISGTSKAASVALWGIFSQRVKKSFHCNNCGFEW